MGGAAIGSPLGVSSSDNRADQHDMYGHRSIYAASLNAIYLQIQQIPTSCMLSSDPTSWHGCAYIRLGKQHSPDKTHMGSKRTHELNQNELPDKGK